MFRGGCKQRRSRVDWDGLKPLLSFGSLEGWLDSPRAWPRVLLDPSQPVRLCLPLVSHCDIESRIFISCVILNDGRCSTQLYLVS